MLKRRWSRVWMWGALAAALTMTLPVNVSCISKVAKNVNPCGTILNCDPVEYDLLMNRNWPDWDLDPTCTIPGLCNGPFPSVGDDDGTTTTTTTTTGF